MLDPGLEGERTVTRVISFWGKGGVGKTTLSASVGIGLAMEGHNVLLISTDPAPSLAEVLGVESQYGSLEAGVEGRFTFLELSENEVIRLWKERFGEEVYTVISSLFPVDKSIIDYVAGAPGIADEFTMYYVMEAAKKGEHDYIVWDTPAAGGSLRLLRIEWELYTHLGEASKLYLRIKSVIDKIRRGPGDPLSLINEWRRIAWETLSFMSSNNHLTLVVTSPTRLGLHVTRRLVNELSLHGIVVRRILVNMIRNEKVCLDCQPWVEEARREKRVLEEIMKLFGENPGVSMVPYMTEEVRGVHMLYRLYKEHVKKALEPLFHSTF